MIERPKTNKISEPGIFREAIGNLWQWALNGTYVGRYHPDAYKRRRVVYDEFQQAAGGNNHLTITDFEKLLGFTDKTPIT